MSEVRLIDANALKEAIDDYAEKRQDTLLWQSDIEDLIDNAPTVEPKKEIVPVCNVTFDKQQLQEIVDKAIKGLQWIPITYRPMTEEEEKELCAELGIKEGSLEDWEKRIFTCPLPDDGQEILTSSGRYVREDICSWDEYGCGLENNGDWDGIDAWMPKPEPYESEGRK